MDSFDSRVKVDVLFEDADLIAVVKPSGMPTANAPAGRTSLFTILKARLGQDSFVGVVSRLDAAVSGVVVMAKSQAAAAHLSEQFRNRSVTKRYSAIVTGRFPAPLGDWAEWTNWLIRPAGSGATTAVMAGTDEAQEAKSLARVVRRGGEVSLVELEPITGRRHQLRVQLASRGCPIVGDRLYGSRLPYPLPGCIALHATQIELAHPTKAGSLILSARWPSQWAERFGHLFS